MPKVRKTDKTNSRLRLYLIGVFEDLERQNPDRTVYKVALDAGIDPSLLRKALDGTKSISQAMLEHLAGLEYFPASLPYMLKLKAEDEFPGLDLKPTEEDLIEALRGKSDDELVEMLKARFPNPDDFKRLVQEISGD